MSCRFSSYSGFINDSDLIDKDFFEIIPFEIFEQFHKEIQNGNCLEIDNRTKIRVTDERAMFLISKN